MVIWVVGTAMEQSTVPRCGCTGPPKNAASASSPCHEISRPSRISSTRIPVVRLMMKPRLPSCGMLYEQDDALPEEGVENLRCRQQEQRAVRVPTS